MRFFKASTPDERLLHVIENPRRNAGVLKKINIDGFLSFFKNTNLKKLGLPGINKILILGSIAVTFGLIVYFAVEKNALRKRFDGLIRADSERGFSYLVETKKVLPDVSDYLRDVKKNNPFHCLLR